MQLKDRFRIISQKMLLDFEEAGLGQHAPTKGQNREETLRHFLKEKLPFQYAIETGEIIFRDGHLSRQTDVIIYDRLKCPVFYSNESIMVPIDGTYGIIEVKSALGKEELMDSAIKIKTYKEKAPRDLTILRKPEYVTFQRPNRPFGITFSYQLKKNSLDSLSQNWIDINKEIGVVNNWINMIAVLGEGLIFFERLKADGKTELCLETDAIVNYTLAAIEGKNEGKVRTVVYPYKEDTLMWFYFYLIALLARIAVVPVDIGKYIDPTLPQIIYSVS